MDTTDELKPRLCATLGISLDTPTETLLDQVGDLNAAEKSSAGEREAGTAHRRITANLQLDQSDRDGHNQGAGRMNAKKQLRPPLDGEVQVTRNLKPVRKPGRQTVRTPETAERILAAVRLGTPFHHCVKLVGIGYSTFCEWRNEDAEFREQLDGAIAAGVEKRLRQIQDAADNGDWRAAECWLRLVLPAEVPGGNDWNFPDRTGRH